MKTNKHIYGMVHVQALPGTPGHKLPVDEIVALACSEAQILLDAGFDGLILENMHDVPYLKREVGPEIVAVMTMVAAKIRKMSTCMLGIQVLAGANKASLAIANAANLDFIRAEGFVFGHLADEGYMDAQAGDLLRYRKNIGADTVKIYADVKKKHSAHSITSDVSLGSTIEAAEFFLCDGVIVTGDATGKEVDLVELEKISQNVGSHLLLGSGITADNIHKYWDLADGFIIGSYLKKNQIWSNPMDHGNIETLITEIKRLREADGN